MRIRSRFEPFAILSLMILSACTGGQGGDPGQTTGGTGGDAGGTGGDGGPDTSGEDDYCSGDRWAGPDAPVLLGTCMRSEPGVFRCECSERSANGDEDTARSVTTERCSDALREACAIDLTIPRYCTASAIGTCFPTDSDETWSCQCEGSDELIETEAALCTDALSLRCADSCESAFGGCQQPISAPDAFGCRCGDAGANTNPLPVFGYASCEEALAASCGELCTGAAGECAIGEDDAFDCECSDSERVQVPLDTVGGVGPEACWQGLMQACGEEILPSLVDCESSYDGHEVSCEALLLVRRPGEPLPMQWDFRCACDGGAAEPLQAVTCYRALQASCPGAIPPSAVAAAAGELGALCETAGDCDLGACYVPGNNFDSICSAPCETDDDCPADALCAFIDPNGGRCFATCDSDVECGLRNDAPQNPLFCANRSDIDRSDSLEGGRICIQSSEP